MFQRTASNCFDLQKYMISRRRDRKGIPFLHAFTLYRYISASIECFLSMFFELNGNLVFTTKGTEFHRSLNLSPRRAQKF